MARRALERPATIPLPTRDGEAAGLALDGLWLAAPGEARGGAVIAAPHPLYGGSMESPVVTELAFACERARLSSLRFNWRGVGASAGATTGEGDAAAEDFAAALAFVADSAEGPLVAAGYSFGAAAAVRAARGHPRVRRLLLVAPPPPLLDLPALEAFTGPVLVTTGDRDRIAAEEALAPLVEALPRARLAVLADTDHFFATEGLGELSRVASAWLSGEGDV